MNFIASARRGGAPIAGGCGGTMNYKVKLEIFEGPLDLLLYLIKKEELNIYDIPVARITDQYLQYLELMRLLDLDIAGEFLVMAATLMQIKSRMLLPPDGTTPEEEEEDPREELIRKLLEYRWFKEAASCLEDLESKRRQRFTRSPAAPAEGGEEERFFEASLFDLITAFSKVLKEAPREIFQEIIRDEFTVEEKIRELLERLQAGNRIRFTELFQAAKNKAEIIALFLALLEVIRLRRAVVRQKELFGEIEIVGLEPSLSPVRPA